MDSNNQTLSQTVLIRLVMVAFAALALTPLVFDSLALDDGFMTPKWAWICGWSIFASGLSLTLLLTGYPLKIGISPTGFSIIALVILHWISIVWSSSPNLALERATRISWILVAGGLGLHFLRDEVWLRRTATLVVGLAFLTSLWVLVEDAVRAWMPERVWISPNLPDWRGYISAGLGNTNHIGDFLGLAIVPSLVMHGNITNRKVLALNSLALVIIPAAMVVCYSVGSTLGLILALLLTAALIITKEGFGWLLRHPRRWVLITVAWAGVILFFTTDQPLNPHRPGIFSKGFDSDRWKEGLDTRLAIWAQGLEIVRHNSLAGSGAGNFSYLFPEQDSPLLIDHPHLRIWQGKWTNAAHNELLQTWAELGIIGLFLFISTLIFAFHSLLSGILANKSENFYSRVIIAGMLAAWTGHSMMNFCLQHPTGALCFFGILMSVMIEKDTRSRSYHVPALRWEAPPLVIHVGWEKMNRPSELGLSLILSPLTGKMMGIIVILLTTVMALGEFQPVRAQRLYRRARITENLNLQVTDRLYREALDIHTNASDCRSRYSEWLIQHDRYGEALEQLKIVRKRLHANEIWLREYRALVALGRDEEASAIRSEFHERFWIPPEAGPVRQERLAHVDLWMNHRRRSISRP